MITEIIPGRKHGSMVSSLKCDCCWHLVSSVKVPAALTLAEVIDVARTAD